MKIYEPFRQAGWWFRVSEFHFELRCTCGVTQCADALTKRDGADATLYDCPHCGKTLVGVAADDSVAGAGVAQLDDDGHRMCGFIFGSTVDMTLAPPGTTGEGTLEIPARPRFFSDRGAT